MPKKIALSLLLGISGCTASPHPVVPLSDMLGGFKPYILPVSDVENFGPGAIVEELSRPLSVAPICTKTGSIGAVSPLSSDAIALSGVQSHSTTVSVNADVKDLVAAKAGVSVVSSMTLSLSSAKLLTLAAQDVQQGRTGRNPACTAAIALSRSDHNGESAHRVTMITQSVIADVVYSFEFKDGVSAEAKVDAMKKIAATVGADVTSGTDGTTKVTGKQVLIGYLDNPKLVD